MSSNLRSKPVEGHVTDSAGNVLRNSQIIIKQATPYGSITVGSIVSDDDGYFKSKPLSNGVYDIYEKGINIAKTIHIADKSAINCFRPGRDHYDTTLLLNFNSLTEGDNPLLNSYKYFLQIEPEELDISAFGSTYPIYQEYSNDPNDNDLSTNADETNEIYNIARYFNFSPVSRITTTRFDIEYFAPLTALSSYYKRIRWAGVPGIRVSEDSKLIVPLDYFSVVASLPKRTSNFVEGDNIDIEDTVIEKVMKLIEPAQHDDFETHVNNMLIGDIVKVTVMGSSGVEGPVYFYGLVIEVDKTTTRWFVRLEKWLSSRFVSDLDLGEISDAYVTRVESFDGMFSGIVDINDDVNERFTVVENINAQNNVPELYNYNNQGGLVPAPPPME